MKCESEHIKLLIEVKKYIEDAEEIVDGEWGVCRDWKEIVNDGDMPELYDKVISAIKQID